MAFGRVKRFARLRRGRSRSGFRRRKTRRPIGRGRRAGPRVKKFKKGAGRLMTRGMEVTSNPVMQGGMALARRRNTLCNPPMGRIWGSQGNLYQEKFTKVTAVWTYTQISSNVNPVGITLCASDFFSLSGGPPITAQVPEMYQALHGWRTFTILGMKMEVFAEPMMVSTATVGAAVATGPAIITVGQEALLLGPGRSFSTVSAAVSTTSPGIQTFVVQYGSLYSIARPTVAYPITGYTSQEAALVDPTYKSESFMPGWSTTHLPRKPKRFFSRYTPFEYVKTAHEGVTDAPPLVGSQFTTPPSLNGDGIGSQYDMFIQYLAYNSNVVNFNAAPDVNTPPINLYVRGTLYIRMVGRYQNDTTMYPVYMTPLGLELSAPSGDGI